MLVRLKAWQCWEFHDILPLTSNTNKISLFWYILAFTPQTFVDLWQDSLIWWDFIQHGRKEESWPESHCPRCCWWGQDVVTWQRESSSPFSLESHRDAGPRLQQGKCHVSPNMTLYLKCGINFCKLNHRNSPYTSPGFTVTPMWRSQVLGLAESKQYWIWQREGLQDTNFEKVAVERNGWGNSSVVWLPGSDLMPCPTNYSLNLLVLQHYHLEKVLVRILVHRILAKIHWNMK